MGVIGYLESNLKDRAGCGGIIFNDKQHQYFCSSNDRDSFELAKHNGDLHIDEKENNRILWKHNVRNYYFLDLINCVWFITIRPYINHSK